MRLRTVWQCDKCHDRSTVVNDASPPLGWHINNEGHNDESYCPQCAKDECNLSMSILKRMVEIKHKIETGKEEVAMNSLWAEAEKLCAGGPPQFMKDLYHFLEEMVIEPWNSARVDELQDERVTAILEDDRITIRKQ